MGRRLSRVLRESPVVEDGVRIVRWGFWCPGCRHPHMLPIETPPGEPNRGPWTFSADLDAPTITPSVHVNSKAWTDPDDASVTIPAQSYCHATVTNGVITFLEDSHGHKLRGAHLLPPFPHPEDGPPLLNPFKALLPQRKTWRAAS